MKPTIKPTTTVLKTEPTYKCRSCKKDLSDATSLSAHIKSSACLFRSLIRVPVVRVTRLKTYLCSSCGLILYSKEQLEPHFKLFHGEMGAEDLGEGEEKIMSKVDIQHQFLEEFHEIVTSKPLPDSTKPNHIHLPKTAKLPSCDVQIALKKSKKRRRQNASFLSSTQRKTRRFSKLRKIAAQNAELVLNTNKPDLKNRFPSLSPASDASELHAIIPAIEALETECTDLFDVIEISD